MTHRQIVTVGIAALSTAVLAQAPQPPPQTPPQGAPQVTFQAEVNYVDVDTTVTDDKGNFVTGLSKEDFEVREDGKLQAIDMFTMVDIPVTRPDRFLYLDRPVTSDVRSNREAFAGRVYVIVLDDLDISPQRTAHTRRLARDFIEKHFGANDMAAVVYTSGRSDAAQEFTGDPRLLLAAINKFVGRRMRSEALDRIDRYYQSLITQQPSDNGVPDPDAPESPPQRDMNRFDPSDFQRSQRAMGVLDTLKNLSEYLSRVRGRRKAVVMLSEGIDYPITDLFAAGGATTIVRETQDAVTAAARANVNFFTIDPRGLIGMTTEFIESSGTGMPEILGNGANNAEANALAVTPFNGPREFLDEMRLAQSSLRTLAEQTGGFASLDNNDTQGALDRIVQANSRYYVLGYYPPTHPRDGAFHKIEVRVKRPGLKVYARKGYASPRGKTPAELQREDESRRMLESKQGGAGSSPPLRDALNSPMQQGALSFAVQAAPFRKSDKESSVALAIEIEGRTLQLAQRDGLFSDSIELSFFGVNEAGKASKATHTLLNLALRPETYQRVRAAGLRANARLSLPPGRYQIRIGVRQSAADLVGSVFYDLQVPDFTKDPLMMSGLLLAAPSSEQVLTTQPDPVVAKMLSGAATSRREFLRSDTLSLAAELYDNNKSVQTRQIGVVTHLIAETGAEAFTARDTLTNGGAKKWDTYAYTRQIPLQNVAPGRYLLLIEAQVQSNTNDKPASRETLITVR